MSRVREYVWRKRRRCPGAVPETAHVLEVGKQLQVLTVDFAIKRAVEVFTVHRRHRRRESVLVKELLATRKGRSQTILADNRWQGCSAGFGFGREIRLIVRRRSQCGAMKLWLVNKVSDTPGKVARPIIKTT